MSCNCKNLQLQELQLGAFLTDPKAPLSTVQVVSEHLQQLMVFVHHLCHASFLLDYLQCVLVVAEVKKKKGKIMYAIVTCS